MMPNVRKGCQIKRLPTPLKWCTITGGLCAKKCLKSLIFACMHGESCVMFSVHL